MSSKRTAPRRTIRVTRIRVPVWQFTIQELLVVKFGGLALGVSVVGSDGQWDAYAFQVANKKGKPREEKIAAALDEHSHDIIGHFETAAEAKKAGEAYARKWVADVKRTKACSPKKPCQCKPIKRAAR